MKGWKEALYPQFQKWVEKGSLFVIADTHFGEKPTFSINSEKGIIELPHLTDEQLVKNINEVVHKNDTLIVLGDVGDVSFIKQLNCYKVLISGNHDAGISNYKLATDEEMFYCEGWMDMEAFGREVNEARSKGREYFDAHFCEIKNKYESEGKNKLLNTLKGNKDFIGLTSGEYYHRSPVWTAHYSNKLFDEVYDGPLFISPRIILSHEPISLAFGLNIHGHTHTVSKVSSENAGKGSKKLCVCQGLHYGYPVNIGQLIDNGLLHDVIDLHRITINQADARKRIKKRKKAKEAKA